MKKGLLLILAIVFIAFNTNAQIFSDDFQDDDITDWVTVSPNYAVNPYNWHTSEYSGEFYLSVSAYDGSADTEATCWIISPSFSTVGYTDLSVTFDNRGRYNVYQDIELYVSTDFAGDSASFDAATWTQVTGFEADVSYEDYDWVLGASASLGDVGEQANVYIAFKYVSIVGTGGNWVVDNVVVSETSSVSEINNNLSIFPNPATSELNIRSHSNIKNIAVSNVIGQRVLSVDNVNANNHSIELTSLAKGVYLLNIENVDGTSSIVKFVKR